MKDLMLLSVEAEQLFQLQHFLYWLVLLQSRNGGYDLQVAVYEATFLKDNIFFGNNSSERIVDGVELTDVVKLHEHMKSAEFQNLSYEQQISNVFTKSFEIQDSLDYNLIEDSEERHSKIVSALRLATFGISYYKAFNFTDFEGNLSLIRNGQKLDCSELAVSQFLYRTGDADWCEGSERTTCDWLFNGWDSLENDQGTYECNDSLAQYLITIKPYELIPSSTTGEVAFDKKYHFLLSLGSTIGQNTTGDEDILRMRSIFYISEIGSALGPNHLDFEDVSADIAGQQFGIDLLNGTVDMRTFDSTDYL